ncbi:MAG: CNNM domain-containing protein [Acidimicrobiales bacterium]
MTTAELVMVNPCGWLLASAFLALAETALTHEPGSAQAPGRGRPQAPDLAALLERPERFLNPVLLVVLVCQLVQATLTGILADRWFGPWGVAVATFINVVVVFVVAESAPKTWALLHGDRAALAVARPVRWLIASAPVRLASRALIGLTNVILPGKGLPDGPFVTEEEILAMADEAVRGEVLEAEEAEMIEQIIEFGDTVVREVMVPRPDMVAVPSTFRIADVMEVAILNGYSRIPAEGADIDDIVGIVHAKDLMRAERDGHGDEAVTRCMRASCPGRSASPSCCAMQAQQYSGDRRRRVRRHAGLVTLEDLIEELVGEIVDEFDREEASLEPVPGGAVRAVAHARARGQRAAAPRPAHRRRLGHRRRTHAAPRRQDPVGGRVGRLRRRRPARRARVGPPHRQGPHQPPGRHAAAARRGRCRAHGRSLGGRRWLTTTPAATPATTPAAMWPAAMRRSAAGS